MEKLHEGVWWASCSHYFMIPMAVLKRKHSKKVNFCHSIVKDHYSHHNRRPPKNPCKKLSPGFVYLDTRVSIFCLTALPRLVRPSNGVPASFGNINTKPDNNRSSCTERKEEREPIPVVARFIDDCLDDVRSNHRRCTIRKTEETEELSWMSTRFNYLNGFFLTMLSYPGGVSSAIIVWEKA